MQDGHLESTWPCNTQWKTENNFHKIFTKTINQHNCKIFQSSTSQKISGTDSELRIFIVHFSTTPEHFENDHWLNSMILVYLSSVITCHRAVLCHGLPWCPYLMNCYDAKQQWYKIDISHQSIINDKHYYSINSHNNLIFIIQQ